ncbi:Alpha/Beta hydrolase protein [Thamnocephalis sphaerospora]|uniref:sn-1-specific diacylglycerol lipase n=1 Tax=Thamnocephalis sphaerospora TaxID=78915 RepID=A0A4P9XVK6_9FUNG|nr:Alpha/Beta hydrolase protein [Thamnocephalis sphaerospora]|eukprot:RKP09641.1 Alpha/Beta hydrolase protein [Thamnocephalis sphaerospora]
MQVAYLCLCASVILSAHTALASIVGLPPIVEDVDATVKALTDFKGLMRQAGCLPGTLAGIPTIPNVLFPPRVPAAVAKANYLSSIGTEDQWNLHAAQFDQIISEDFIYRYAIIGPPGHATRLLTDDIHVDSWRVSASTGFFVAVSKRQRTVTLAFRGTSTLEDFFFNANPIIDASAAVRQALLAYPGYSLVVAGHSLGAVAAQLFSLHATLHSLFPIAAVYGFGEPASMSLPMAEWSLAVIGREKFVRVISGRDITPSLRANLGGIDHARNARVAWVPNPEQRGTVICENGNDARCGTQMPCYVRSFRDHNRLGGLRFSSVCSLGLAA